MSVATDTHPEDTEGAQSKAMANFKFVISDLAFLHLCASFRVLYVSVVSAIPDIQVRFPANQKRGESKLLSPLSLPILNLTVSAPR